MSKQLNPAQREILIKLIEEASEAIQAAAKLDLHGPDSREPGTDGPNNQARLESELGELLYFMQLADDYRLISMDKVFLAQRKKAARKNQYLHHVDPT